MLTERRASGVDDLRAAVASMSAAWLVGAPHAAGTPASIEWWYALTHPEPLSEHLRLWYAGDTLVGWAWHEPPELETHVWTADPATDERVFGAIVDAALGERHREDLAAFAADDDAASIRVLLARGFQPEGRRLSQWQWRADDDPPPDRPLPRGYRIRSVRGPEEFDARVALHRAAFPASRLTVAKYERLLTVPHYRLDDDLVVEAADGSLAAFALTWYDPEGRVGELEPVGTHPDHQRRGLSRALVSEAARRLFQRGAHVVQVYSDQAEPAAEALYAAAGFKRRASHRRYVAGPRTTPDGTIDT
ncbi:MAG TPA: GNAT family N-acetyltransferase [Candidatus Limnocylindrales bacterium]|nr:GNAT family N-acetyltransferase [Candidatus Limnocylindrales bacterium]